MPPKKKVQVEDKATDIAPVEAQEQFAAQVVDLIKEIAQDVRSLTDRVGAIEKGTVKAQRTVDNQPVPEPGKVLAIGGQSRPVAEDSFFTAVPAGIELAAREILTDSEFVFEVRPLSDEPAFEFTVFVPHKYSDTLPAELLAHGGRDKRVKVISNADNINGVREYCRLIKSNIVKYLGMQVNQNVSV